MTAYDADGTESDYSDEICVINGEACPESWLASRSNLSSADSASGGSGGGGSGCFISTSNYTENNKSVLSSKHIFLFLMYLTVIGIIGLINKRIISA